MIPNPFDAIRAAVAASPDIPGTGTEWLKCQPINSNNPYTPMTDTAPEPQNKITLKWGTLKTWKLHTPEAMAAIKQYHSDPVEWSVMMQRDTPAQKQALYDLIDQCDVITLVWEGKDVSREDAKDYIRNYGATKEAQ